MEVCLVVLGCGASLDEVEVGALLDDDQGVLELAGALGVQTEIGLQGVVHTDALGDVDEGATRPNGVVEGRELVVTHGNEGAEVLVYHGLPLRVVQGVLDGGVDDAGLGDLLAHVVIDDFGVVLGADAGQALALGLGDAQAFKGVLDVLGDIVPVLGLLGACGDIGGDVVHVQAGGVRTPVVGHVHVVIDLEGFQTHVQHPLGLGLLLGDGTDDVGGQTIGVALVALLGHLEVIEGAVDVCHLGAALVVHLLLGKGKVLRRLVLRIAQLMPRPSRPRQS